MSVNNETTSQKEAALLYWVNTFPLDSPVQSLQQLNDGQALAKVLADIDPSFHPTDLKNTSNPTNWIPRWENLKLVTKALGRYTQEDCAQQAGLALTQNLKRIAEEADTQELIELLSVILLASVLGPKNATYIPKISESEHAAALAAIIQDKSEQDSAAAAGKPIEQTFPTNTAIQAVDIDLAVEEKHGELITRNSVLQRENEEKNWQNADLLTRLDKLQEINSDLHERLLTAEDKSTELSQRLEITNPEYQKYQEDRIREQDILISTQEKQIEDDGNTKSTLQSQLHSLRTAADENKELKIQVNELKYERDELSKKANAIERYKQKLESQKHLEPENTRLKADLAEASQEIAKLSIRVDQFEATQAKYQSTIQNQELALHELRIQKTSIESDYRTLEQEVALLREREEHDSAMINELQEKVAHGAGTGTSSALDSPIGKSIGMSLQAEMDQAEPSGPNLELEVSRLRTQNELLKGGAHASQEKFDLEMSLSEATRIRDTIEKKYQVLFEEHVILQRQLSSIIEGRAKEGSELDKTYKDLSTRLALEVQDTKKKIDRLEAELGDKNRELLAAQAELSMVDNEEMEQIEILKNTNSTIVSSLESDYKILRARYEALVDESTIQKAQLTEALLSKDKIRNERDDLTSRMVEAVKEKEESIKTQSTKITELQDRLKNSADGGDKKNDIKTDKDEEIMNLKRENTLMATAWYDLTTRIQSNNVILQRRSDAPKSWINKHRQAALGAMPRR